MTTAAAAVMIDMKMTIKSRDEMKTKRKQLVKERERVHDRKIK